MRQQPDQLKEKIAIYKQWLVRGDIGRIARETRYTTNMVYLTLRGDRINMEIIKATRERALSNARYMGVDLEI